MIFKVIEAPAAAIIALGCGFRCTAGHQGKGESQLLRVQTVAHCVSNGLRKVPGKIGIGS